MANKTLNTRLIIKNDTATNWTSNNPVLLKGEMGIEMGTKIKFKVGDGTTSWNNLDYFQSGLEVLSGSAAPSTSTAGELGQMYYATGTSKMYMCYKASSPYTWKQMVTPDDLADLGAGDMLKSVYDTNDNGRVDTADALYNSATSSNVTIDDSGAASTSVIWTSNKINDIVASVDAMRFKGVVNSNSDLPSSGVKVGDTYRVGTAGTYSGQTCEVGDMIIATATTSTWAIIQANIDGAVTSSASSVTDGHITVFDGSTGKIIKTSGIAASNVLLYTDSYILDCGNSTIS